MNGASGPLGAKAEYWNSNDEGAELEEGRARAGRDAEAPVDLLSPASLKEFLRRVGYGDDGVVLHSDPLTRILLQLAAELLLGLKTTLSYGHDKLPKPEGERL
jgi:hypothetical protein